MISLINTENNSRLENPKIQVIKYTSFFGFNLKIFIKNSSQFSKLYLVISSSYNIVSIKCKIGHSSVREYLVVDGMINCAFLIFQNCNNCVKDYIPFSSRLFCSLRYIHELKAKWNVISI